MDMEPINPNPSHYPSRSLGSLATEMCWAKHSIGLALRAAIVAEKRELEVERLY
jgi:hypothetical protein